MAGTLALVLMTMALAAALVPVPAGWVDVWYSRGFYLALQRVLTPAADALPMRALDLAVLTLAVVASLWAWQRLRRRSTRTWQRRGGAIARRTLVAASVLYLWFLAAWGLNYRRTPLVEQLDYDDGRVTSEALVGLAERTVEQLNRLHPLAHRLGWPPLAALATEMEPGMRRALDLLGLPVPTPPQPRHTVLEPYFRWAGIDGFTDPFFLEVLLRADLAAFERPFALAHEWAHLAGVARAGDASLVAWIACQVGPEPMRYSGWLALAPDVWGALAPSTRSAMLERLDAGPRRDFAQIEARLARAVPALRRAAWGWYDRFLKAQRIEQGIASYDEFVQLVLATRIGDRPAALLGEP